MRSLVFCFLIFAELQIVFPGNPEENMNTGDLIKFYGYPFEEHFTVSPDGYVVITHRIPSSPYSCPIARRVPVLMFHGILGSSATFLDNTRERSLGFLLADQGFDVWLTNVRGNNYSQLHRFYTSQLPQYWDFSFQESSLLDVPILIDYILKVTGHSKLFYIGYSMGTTIGFTLLSILPQYNEKIYALLQISPVANLQNSPTVQAANGFKKFTYKLKKILPVKTQIVDQIQPRIIHSCQNLIFQPFCLLAARKYSGDLVDKFNLERLPVYFHHVPEPISWRTINHYLQIFQAQRLQLYDYGNYSENYQKYNQILPPIINFSKITVPVALFTSLDDTFSDVEDVNYLIKQLPNLQLLERITKEGFGHLSFLWSVDAVTLVYNKMINFMKITAADFNRCNQEVKK